MVSHSTVIAPTVPRSFMIECRWRFLVIVLKPEGFSIVALWTLDSYFSFRGYRRYHIRLFLSKLLVIPDNHGRLCRWFKTDGFTESFVRLWFTCTSFATHSLLSLIASSLTSTHISARFFTHTIALSSLDKFYLLLKSTYFGFSFLGRGLLLRCCTFLFGLGQFSDRFLSRLMVHDRDIGRNLVLLVNWCIFMYQRLHVLKPSFKILNKLLFFIDFCRKSHILAVLVVNL